MSLRTLGQILRFSYNFSPDIPVVMNSHKNRKYVIDKHRCFAKKAKQQNLVAEERSRSCPGKKDKKDSFWGGLFGSGAPKKQPKKVADCCEQQKEKQCHQEPDLSAFDGQGYRTAGPAYVVQKERQYASEKQPSKEDKILKKLEAHPDLKDYTEDPMPPFTTVEQRMMDLNLRKLHPLYKMYQSIPKKTKLEYCKDAKTKKYKTRSGPVGIHDIPEQLKINKQLLEKKNMFSDYKRVEPPRQMIARLVEIEQNATPTLERKRLGPKKPPKRKAVFESLQQEDSITLENINKKDV